MNSKNEILLNGALLKRFIDKKISEIAAEFNLKKIELEIISYLDTAGERNTARDILELGIYTKGHISQAIAHLGILKIINLSRDPDDHRCVRIFLEKSADEILEKLKKAEDEMRQAVFNGISEEELQIFMTIGRKIASNISEII